MQKSNVERIDGQGHKSQHEIKFSCKYQNNNFFTIFAKARLEANQIKLQI